METKGTEMKQDQSHSTLTRRVDQRLLKVESIHDFLRRAQECKSTTDIHKRLFGLKCIDDNLDVIENGSLIVLGGRPMQGKEYILDKFIVNVAKDNKTLVCNFHQSDYAFAKRLRYIIDSVLEIGNNIYTLCADDITFKDLIETLEDSASDCKFIFIDNIKYCFTDNDRDESYLPVYALCELRKYAITHNKIIVCAYTTSWEADERSGADGKVPQMIDFEGIADFADVVLGVFRPEYYHIYQDETGNSLKSKVLIYALKAPIPSDLSFDIIEK